MLLALGCLSSVHAESRTWTNAAGKTIDGELVSKKDDSVSIKNARGKVLVLKASSLSTEDQAYIDEWKPEESAQAPGVGEAKASNIKFKWNKSDTQAFKLAKENKLPVAILFTGTSWCGYCIKLEKEVLSKKEFKDGMNGLAIGLICVSPSAGQWKGYGKELSKKYGVSGVPKIVVVDADGKELGQTGYVPGQPPSGYIAFFKKFVNGAAD